MTQVGVPTQRPESCGFFFALSGLDLPFTYDPRLAPWAAFFRLFAAETCLSRKCATAAPLPSSGANAAVHKTLNSWIAFARKFSSVQG